MEIETTGLLGLNVKMACHTWHWY